MGEKVFIYSPLSFQTHMTFFTFFKMLGCFNPILGQIWTNPAIGLHF